MLAVKSFGYRIGLQDAHKLFKREIHRKNSFYDSLGITPKATQADIKKAFYKLSKEFHPDKSTGNDVKFKEISAAYEVLGNLKLRRLYDRDIFPSGFHNNIYNQDEQNYESQFSQQYPNNIREKPKRQPMSGKSSTYDYDAWTRAHYEDTFTRTNRSKWMYRQSYRSMKTAQARSETFMWILGGMMMSLIFYNATFRHQWDKPRRKEELRETEANES